ncbi:MAG: AAA family ATPase [Candidatus Micrarchaeota archaeon]
MIIGLTGTFGAGKGEISRVLGERGYAYHSCSDVLREELKALGKEETIESLAGLGNEIRAKFGAGELPKRLIAMIRECGEEKAIVDSIRSIGEVEELRKEKDFVMLSVQAPIELRYERIRNRGRKGDDISFEELTNQENAQMGGSDATQNLGKCMSMADYRVVNDGTLEELEKKVVELLSKMEG